jgi:hypothetical protein
LNLNKLKTFIIPCPKIDLSIEKKYHLDEFEIQEERG